MIGKICVHVPATTANLGPGFDCLALALDLWNSATFQIVDGESTVQSIGEGAKTLPWDGSNRIVQAAKIVFERCHQPMPGLQVECINRIPLGSGLGSSAAANLSGLLGANALLGGRLQRNELLDLAVELEGHPDNAAAALYGGLVVIIKRDHQWLVQRFDLPTWQAAYVLPEMDFPTHAARAALPKQVKLSDAVFNIGRAVLVVEGLRSGNVKLLGEVIEDRLHQPYRLPLIAGAAAVLEAARQNGAAAAALSGAGPSVIAFLNGNAQPTANAMLAAFQAAGVDARAITLQTVNRGAEVVEMA